MAKLLKLRRGTNTQHSSFTGAEGEVTVNTTNDSLHVHDGTTAGGTELAKADLSNVDGSLSNNLGFADGTKALFGTGNDLEIEHTGSGSFIRTSTTATGDLAIEARNGGDLYLTGADDVLIRSQGGEAGLKVVGDGAVEAYYDNSLKLTTTSTGINVTGTVACDGLQCDGDATVNATDGILTLKDSNSTGNANSNYIRGRDSSNTTKWYVGHASSSNQDLYLSNTAGGQIQFRSSDALRITMQAAGHWVPAGTAQDLGTSGAQWRNAYFDGTVNCDALSCGGDATFDNGTSTTVNVICDNNGRAEIRSMGDDQGTGVFYAGQNSNTGGGIFYNGDGTPQYATGEASDRVSFFRRSSGTNEVVFSYSYNSNTTVFRGSVHPDATNSYDLGSGNNRWRNIYTNDLNLSNEGGTNDVDGTWGSWTIQEGEDDLFLLNRRNGKKYKFNLSEVN